VKNTYPVFDSAGSIIGTVLRTIIPQIITARGLSVSYRTHRVPDNIACDVIGASVHQANPINNEYYLQLGNAI